MVGPWLLPGNVTLRVLVPSPLGLSPCTLNPFLFRPLLAQEPALSPLPRGTASPSAPSLLQAPAVPSPAATSSPSPPGCQFPLAAARTLRRIHPLLAPFCGIWCHFPLAQAGGDTGTEVAQGRHHVPVYGVAGGVLRVQRGLGGVWGCLFAPQGWKWLSVGLVAQWHLYIGGGIPLAWQWGHWSSVVPEPGFGADDDVGLIPRGQRSSCPA